MMIIGTWLICGLLMILAKVYVRDVPNIWHVIIPLLGGPILLSVLMWRIIVNLWKWTDKDYRPK